MTAEDQKHPNTKTPAETTGPTLPSICVVGLGYVGLPTASILATKGYSVRGVDVHQYAVDTINAGRIHIREPELEALVRSAVQSGHLKAHLAPARADVFILAVPTPFKEDHVPDLRHVEEAARAVAAHLEPGNLVILESTSPVGATEDLVAWLREERPDLQFPQRQGSDMEANQVCVAHCPERVLPGKILKELIANDRVVGGVDEASTERAAGFYRAFVSGEVTGTDSRTAELAKLTENTFRDVNIALANELSLICDKVGVDVQTLIGIVNRHPRVNLHQPGPGVGGHCIAVDPWFIVHAAPEHARLIRTAREVNDAKPLYVFEKVRRLARRMKDPVIACFGLSYKADIDDLRESPAVEVVRRLAQEFEGRILVVEPYLRDLPKSLADLSVELVDQSRALQGADIVVGLVDHRPFRRLSAADLSDKLVVDMRGMWR